jgi:uncharacterized protein (DUF2147 family)
MKKLLSILLVAASIASTASTAWAAGDSPIGMWKTISDVDGKVSSMVMITEVNGQLQGKIDKLFPKPGEDLNPKCIKCTDARKDQPIIGMTFLSGMKKDNDQYTGGEILDPNNGKIYKCKMELIDGGKKLKVRGFIGVALFGRNQTWQRAE